MRGDDLLLAHLGLLVSEAEEERPSARERLEAELGAELTRDLLASLSGRPTLPRWSNAAPGAPA